VWLWLIGGSPSDDLEEYCLEYVYSYIIQYSPLEFNARFGGSCCPHLQCPRIFYSRNQLEVSSKNKVGSVRN
jgi:hypothetical protein